MKALAWGVVADLGAGDAMDSGGVGLAVSTSAEAEPLVVPRPDGDGSVAVPGGKGVPAREATNVGGFPTNLAAVNAPQPPTRAAKERSSPHLCGALF